MFLVRQRLELKNLDSESPVFQNFRFIGQTIVNFEILKTGANELNWNLIWDEINAEINSKI